MGRRCARARARKKQALKSAELIDQQRCKPPCSAVERLRGVDEYRDVSRNTRLANPKVRVIALSDSIIFAVREANQCSAFLYLPLHLSN